MQPMPETCILHQQELVTITEQPVQTTGESPVVVHLSERRRRTIIEQCSPHTQLVRPSHISTVVDADITYEWNQNKPSINDFLLSPSEKATRNKLLKDLHLAMLVKLCHLSENSSTLQLPSLPSLIHCLQKQAFESVFEYRLFRYSERKGRL